MASDGLSVNAVIMTIVSVSLGIVMIGSLLAPIASDVMSDLTAKVGNVPVYANGETWASLIGVVVMMVILGLVVLSVNQYTKK